MTSVWWGEGRALHGIGLDLESGSSSHDQMLGNGSQGRGQGGGRLRSGLVDVSKPLPSLRTSSVSEGDRIGGHRRDNNKT